VALHSLTTGNSNVNKSDLTYSNITNLNGDVVNLWEGWYGDHDKSGVWIRWYDGQRRANRGVNDYENWDEFDDTDAYLEPGVAYRIISYKDSVLDFNLKNAEAIKNLFKYEDKTGTLVKYYTDPNHRLLDNSPSEGWNILGGLNTSSFKLNKTNLGWTTDTISVIYYYDKNVSGTWRAKLLSQDDIILSPYVPYYVQTGYDFTLKYVKDGLEIGVASPIGFRSSTAEAEIPNDMLRLSFTKGTLPITAVNDGSNPDLISDRMYFEFSNGFRDRFILGEDALKLLTDVNEALSPQLWSWYEAPALLADGSPVMRNNTPVIDNFPLFLNRLPRPGADKKITLGVSVPETGAYTFGLEALRNESLQAVVLHDVDANKYVDLLSDDYSVPNLAKGEYTKRFELFITESVTQVDNILKGIDIFAYAENNILTVKNLQNDDRVKVLDLSGRTIAYGTVSGNEFSVNLNQKGVYLVDVRGDKNVVLKVLNK
jgi:hypothetical protein